MPLCCPRSWQSSATHPTLDRNEYSAHAAPPKLLEQLQDYIQAADLPIEPCDLIDGLPWYREGGKVFVPITLKEWSAAIGEMLNLFVRERDLVVFVQGSIDLTLVNRGFDLRRVRDDIVVAKIERVARCPSFIRDAFFLTADEKLQIAEMANRENADDSVEDVQRFAVKVFGVRRCHGDDALSGTVSHVLSRLPRCFSWQSFG